MKFKERNDHQLLATKLLYSDNHKIMTYMLNRYVTLERKTTAEQVLAEFVFDDIEAQSLTMLAVCTTLGKRNSIQTLIGILGSSLLQKNLDAGKVFATYTCVAEFMLSSPEIFKQIPTFYGASKCESTFYDAKEAEKKLFQLPSLEPTKNHKSLGKWNWKATTTKAVDKLNKVPLVLLDYEEDIVPPEGTEDRVKYDIRKAIRPSIAKSNTAIYFDWHMDYRGRMYSSGEMLATL